MQRSGRGVPKALAVAGAVAALLAAGCGTQSQPTGPAKDDGSGGSPASTGAGGPLRVVAAQPPARLDPANLVDLPSSILSNFYVQLVKFGETDNGSDTQRIDQSKLEPYLATSWKDSAGGKTWTFTLKPGLKFASGTAVDAAAVKYSLERALKGISSYFVSDGLPGNVKSIAAPAADTVVVHLAAPDPHFPAVMALPGSSIVDPSVVSKQGKAYLDSHEAGSGPYQLADYQPNRSMVLKARPGFAQWAGWGPASKEIDVDYAPDDSAFLLKVRSKQADVAIGLTKQSVSSLQSSSDHKVVVSATAVDEQVLLPWKKGPWKSADVRKAAALAVPYDGIVKSVAKGYAAPFYGPLNPGLGHYSKDLSAPMQTDVDQAKQLIQQSGVKTPINVTLTIDQGNTTHQQIATLLQSAWKAIGINLKISQQPAAAYNDAMFGHKVEAALRLDGPAYLDPGFFLGYDMRCETVGAGTNPGDICIPAADKLLDAARASGDETANQQRYDQITKLWREQSPKIWIYNDREATVLSPQIKEWRWDPNGTMFTWSR